jgi:hypothetical protein
MDEDNISHCDELMDTSYLNSNFKSVFIDHGANSNLIEENSTRSTDEVRGASGHSVPIVSDIIPTMIKIIYSIPSFGKMSCLVLLK